jgi:hypothetical protein
VNRGGEAVDDVGVLQLRLETPPGVGDHALVIKREGRERAQRVPRRAPLQVPAQPSLGYVHEREVSHHHFRAAFAEPVECIELFQEDVGHAGLVGELAAGGAVQGFPFEERATREGPHPLARLRSPLDQKR